MKTLHLNLTKKWFDMILSGKKKEEYRKLSNYWFKRLFDLYVTHEGKKVDAYSILSQNSDLMNRDFDYIDFDTITFSNGYAKHRPQFEIEFHSIVIREGNPEWGAEKGTKYFVIKLGKILNKQNC